MIFRFFFTDFDYSKSVLGQFFAFFAKIWPKNTYRSYKSRFFLFDLFYLVTWDDLYLYYGHKAQETILTNVSDTIHAGSLALFALDIEILLADVTKPEKSKTLFRNDVRRPRKTRKFCPFGSWRPQIWPERKNDWNSFVIIFGELSKVFSLYHK